MSDETTAAVQKGLSVPLSVAFGDGLMSRIPTWAIVLLLAFWLGSEGWDYYLNHITEQGIACSKQGGSLNWVPRTCIKIETVIIRIDTEARQ